jgi:hypothetical protein
MSRGMPAPAAPGDSSEVEHGSHPRTLDLRRAEDALRRLSMSAVFLFQEFLESGIGPIVALAQHMPDDAREDFYISLLPHFIAHCKQLHMPLPYETAMFLVNVVKCRV